MQRILVPLLLCCAKRFGYLPFKRCPTYSIVLSGVVVVALLSLATAEGSTTLNATNRGVYTESSGGGVFELRTGDSSPAANYSIGDPFTAAFRESRSFFVFDLSSVTGTIASAELRLFNPVDGFGTTQSVDGSETYDVFDAAYSAALLSGTTPSSAFADLGTGTVFGTRPVSVADNNSTIVVPLNASAVAALNTATGSFAFGGAITTLVPPFLDEREQVFGFTLPGHSTQLVLNVVPEPATLTLLLSIGGLGMALGRSRRSRRAA